MAALADLVRFIPTLGGTTDFVYSSTVGGCQSPTAANLQNGVKYKCYAVSNDLTQFEVFEGVYNSSTGTFPRTTVLYNSSLTGSATPGQSGAGTKINFSTVPQVAVVGLAEDLISIEVANGFTATQKAQARANIDVLKKNYIVNGAMMVSQENGSTAGTTNVYYPVDQFHVNFSNGGSVSIAQVASRTPSGSPNRLRVTVAGADASVAAGDLLHIVQEIEDYRVADLNFGTAAAKQITIQFGVKGPAGTYCVAVANGAQNRCYVAEYVISGGEANTDVVKSVTFTADTTGTWSTAAAATGCIVRFGLMAGSTFQQAAGSWGTTNAIGSSSQFNLMGTSGNVFELFDVSMTEGPAAPRFVVPHYANELVACRRYWESTFPLGTQPASAVGGSGYLAAPSISASANVNLMAWFFTVGKRVVPTVTTYNPFAAGSGISVGGSGNFPVIQYVQGTNSTTFRDSAGGMGVGGNMSLHAKADARL